MDQPDAPEQQLGLSTDPAQARPTSTARPTEPVEMLAASPSPEPMQNDAAVQPFGSALGPVLLDICQGRLTDLAWFRTDWQRGGALTGYANWTDDHGIPHPAVIKLPVPPTEYRWLLQLSSDDVTPRVYAHGSALGGYDLAWIVMERLPHGPLGSKWGPGCFDLLAEAAANFYARARLIPLGDPSAPRDWAGQLKRARQNITKESIPDSQRWRKVLKQAGKQLPGWLDTWHARDTGYWCHGDLHLGNAMSRTPPPTPGNKPDGPAVLFDLASVQPGHWVEDAVYLEHLYWANRSALQNQKPGKLIAGYLRDYGLAPGNNWPELANIYRALLAMVVPTHLSAKGGSPHAAAALEVLERLV